MDLIESLNWRYAVKRFSAQQLPESVLQALIEATRLSASSYGVQPYQLLVIESASIREKLVEYSYGQDKVLHSSHLLVFAIPEDVGDTAVDRYINDYSVATDQPVSELLGYADHIKSVLAAKSKTQRQQWAHQQVHIALGNLLTCAALMEVDTCPMGGFDKDGYDSVLKLTARGFKSSIICPIGYRHPDDKQASVPKVRRNYDDFIMWM